MRFLGRFLILSFALLLSHTSSAEESVVADITNELQNEEFIVNIEQSFDGKSFIARNSFKIQPYLSFKVSLVDIEKNGISSDHVDSFKSLLRNNDYYQIRMSSQLGMNESTYVTASIPACELQKSNFKEEISVYLDGTNSFIVGLSYSSPVVAMSRSCNPDKVCHLLCC
jgi:hypothetical protein